MRNLSPCIAQCKLSEDDICEGCKRTIDEIVGWGRFSQTQKLQVIKRLDLLKNVSDSHKPQ